MTCSSDRLSTLSLLPVLPLLWLPLLTTACGDAFVAGSAGGGGTTTSTTGDTGGTTSVTTGGGGAGGTVTTGGTGGAVTTGGTGGTLECGTNADCAPNETCSPQGTCLCEAPFTDCNGACVDLQTDEKNCASCGTECGNKCVSGTCDDPVAIGAGADNTCAVLRRGSVHCWGRTDTFQLGMMVPDPTGVPAKVAGLAGVKMTRVFVGRNTEKAHVCAISEAGDLYCWGSNQAGKLGFGILDTGPQAPQKVGEIGTLHSVGMGAIATLASDGQDIWGWGANDAGQLGYFGLGSNAPNKGSSEQGNAVAAGNLHGCAIKDAVLRCWGRNVEGQLGLGDNVGPRLPNDVVINGEVHEVTVGDHFTCARVGDLDAVQCWGQNDRGQLGVGDTMGRNLPTSEVALGDFPATAIAGGIKHAAAIANKSVYVWGQNDSGEVDPSPNSKVTQPTALKMPYYDFADPIAIALGASHTCALDKAGNAQRVVCWGGNQFGQVGDGSVGGDHKLPVEVVFP